MCDIESSVHNAYTHPLTQIQKIDYKIEYKQGKSVRYIITDFVQLLIDKGIKIQISDLGSILLNEVVMKKIINNLNTVKYLELSNHTISLEDFCLITGYFEIIPSKPYEMSMELKKPDLEHLRAFEVEYGCKVIL